MKNNLDCITICAALHNFLLLENDEGTEAFNEDDGHASDADAENELNFPVDSTQSKGTMRSQLKQCWAEKSLQFQMSNRAQFYIFT